MEETTSDLSGRTAIVVSASRGLGRGIATALAYAVSTSEVLSVVVLSVVAVRSGIASAQDAVQDALLRAWRSRATYVRSVSADDFRAHGVPFVPEIARLSWLVDLPEGPALRRRRQLAARLMSSCTRTKTPRVTSALSNAPSAFSASSASTRRRRS